jgi:hypothetical protein
MPSLTLAAIALIAFLYTIADSVARICDALAVIHRSL